MFVHIQAVQARLGGFRRLIRADASPGPADEHSAGLTRDGNTRLRSTTQRYRDLVQGGGTVQRKSSSFSTRTVCSGGQFPMRNWCETIRVPGRSSRRNFGSSCALMLVDRYNATTVA